MSIENENLPLQLLSFMLQLILHSILVAFIFCIVGQVMFKLSQYVERKGTNLNAVKEISINLSYFIPITLIKTLSLIILHFHLFNLPFQDFIDINFKSVVFEPNREINVIE